jgi:NagD protein
MSIKKVRLMALDLDGVVYEGRQALAGAVESIEAFRKRGIIVRFLTNNSASSRAEIALKLSRLGVDAHAEEVYSSAYGAARYIVSLTPIPRVLIIGELGLKEEMFVAGVSSNENCDYVVVGLNHRFSYDDITQGLIALRRGAKLIACNRDPFYSIGGGLVRPGCGAMVGAIEAAAGVEACIEIGKPTPMMLTWLMKDIGVAKNEVLVVGDTLQSDIMMANRCGVASAFVTSDSSVTPTETSALLHVKDLSELLRNMES